jgi:hypothetical protein
MDMVYNTWRPRVLNLGFKDQYNLCWIVDTLWGTKDPIRFCPYVDFSRIGQLLKVSYFPWSPIKNGHSATSPYD